jgi:catechol 2,3-dioxygenase-like lactoylglutathione lyase family enzyme
LERAPGKCIEWKTEITVTNASPLNWNGIHHLALYTHDLEATLAFYRDVLGMESGEIALSPRGRHCFIHIEPAERGRPGLHIWEDTSREAPDVAAHRAHFNAGPGVMAHIAFYLPDRESETALRVRLASAGIEVIEFERLGTFAFWDLNGIMIEIVPARYDELHPC